MIILNSKLFPIQDYSTLFASWKGLSWKNLALRSCWLHRLKDSCFSSFILHHPNITQPFSLEDDTLFRRHSTSIPKEQVPTFCIFLQKNVIWLLNFTCKNGNICGRVPHIKPLYIQITNNFNFFTQLIDWIPNMLEEQSSSIALILGLLIGQVPTTHVMMFFAGPLMMLTWRVMPTWNLLPLTGF